MLRNHFHKITQTLIFSFGLFPCFCLVNASISTSTEDLLEKKAVEQDYELRGIFEIDNEHTFSLFQKSTQRAAWGKIGRTMLDIKLLAYNSKSRELTISQGKGLDTILILKEADETPLIFDFQASKNLTEEVLTTEDIDPQKAGKQGYQQARAKLKFSVSPHISLPQNNLIFGADSRKNESNSLDVLNLSEDSRPEEIDKNLSEVEVIAFSLYEKNYISSGKPPRNVDIIFEVSPR